MNITKFRSRSRSNIDIHALHVAYLEEGFVASPPRFQHDNDYTFYQKFNQDNVLLKANVPNYPADDSDLYDKLEEMHGELANALRFLWEETGNIHFEVGSLVMIRNDMDCD